MKTASILLTQSEIDALTKFPIRFEEGNFADYMWGGHELYKLKGIPFDAATPKVAESWEVSGHSKYPSRVKLDSGTCMSLIDLLNDPAIAELILGKRMARNYPNRFPLLAKFFDVQKHMSVQVHPSDQVARQLGESDPGKGEVFVVMDVYPGGEGAVYLGLREGITRKRFEEALVKNENLLEFMHKVQVKPGEVYVFPSGVLHCWTGGTMAIELTEPSDLTYRMYDFGRGRPMHIEKGLASTDFENQNGPDIEALSRSSWRASKISGLEQITTNCDLKVERVCLEGAKKKVHIPGDGTFDVLMGVQGSLELIADNEAWRTELKKGFSLLIPAEAGGYYARKTSISQRSECLRITMDPNGA
jgi:mannose-6-phosphate isomerase